MSLAMSAIIWGLMAPIGKTVLVTGFSAVSLASLRMIGAAVCFWITSLFVKQEKVAPHDYLLMFFAAMFGIMLNQGAYTFGLSMTSPIDASIIVTVLPVITMVLAALFLKEPITWMKATGVFLGLSGALLLILSGSGSLAGGNIWGNLLCLLAASSFACYLTIFRNLIGRYSVFTLMKWMFLFSAISFLPVAYSSLAADFSQVYPASVWLGVGYVVFFGTYVAYIFMLYGQKKLRPTVVSMYNYVQPVVSTLVSVALGLAAFGMVKGFAAVLIFVAVYLVTKSKGRKE